jgi:hypothetical protein
MPDVSADGAQMRDLRALLLGVAAAAIVIGLVAALVFSVGREPSRQDVIADRGAEVMPFDLEKTNHVFKATDFGGVQEVVARDPRDVDQIVLIRGHLRKEADRFRVGDFGDPATIHGHDMPGLAVLEARAADIVIAFQRLSDGARVTYRTEDPELVAALHDWFSAQLADHGAHATGR